MILAPDRIYSKGLRLMGNHFQISAVAEDEARALKAIDAAIAEIQRIEALLTTYKEGSQTNMINEYAGVEPVRVDMEVFGLIERSLRISALTQGAFDITYGSVDKRFWNFDTAMDKLPDPVLAKSLVRLINYRNVILSRNEQTVFLKEKGMRIGFGGIGKGYAADRARIVMQQAGVKSGIVNAAGDLTVWGNQVDGSPWTIGVADPDRKQLPFASMQLTNVSVATSGNYEKYAIIGGKKYSHTIDPKTGYPVQGIKSVTIISSSAEVADVMATPIMVMGIKAGLNLINQVKGIACIIVDDDNGIHASKNINIKDA
jgi:thiamine biosynthesis lipoprotein